MYQINSEKVWVSKNIIAHLACGPLAMENAHSGRKLAKPVIELTLNYIKHRVPYIACDK